MNTATARHSARVPLVLALAAGVALSACTRSTTTVATTPAPQHAGQTSTFPVNHDDWNRLGYRLDWVGFPFPGATPATKVGFVAPYDDVVVLLQFDSTLALLETLNGRTRWSTQLAGPLTKFVSVDRDAFNANNVLVSSESEMFTVSAANGSLLARDRFNRVVNTRPIISGNTATFGTSTGEVMSHVMGRGVKAWGFMSRGAIDADPVLCGDTMAFVSQSGDVMFFGLSGGLVGRAAIYDGLATDPVSDAGLLFIAGLDRSVWCFNPSGLEEWRHRTDSPLRTQPTAHAGTLYVSIPTRGLTAFNARDGKVKWANPNVQGTVIATRGGRLVVRADSGLLTLNPSDGTLIERAATPGIVRVIADKFEDGNLYAVSDRATLARFIPR